MGKINSWLIQVTATTLLSLSGMAALAHHGWSWAEDEQTEMTGTVREIYVGPPHPRLQIDTDDDGQWRVDLGNPNQTDRAGFTANSASEGDTIVVRGHRSQDGSEKLIKAVRITVEGKEYTFYPDRVQED